VWVGGCEGAQEGRRAFAIPKQTSGKHGDEGGVRVEQEERTTKKGKGASQSSTRARVIAVGSCSCNGGWYKRRRRNQSGASRDSKVGKVEDEYRADTLKCSTDWWGSQVEGNGPKANRAG